MGQRRKTLRKTIKWPKNEIMVVTWLRTEQRNEVLICHHRRSVTQKRGIISRAFENSSLERKSSLDYGTVSWKPQTTKNPPARKRKATRRSFVSVKETEFIVKNLPEKKSPSPHGFIGQVYQTPWEELTPPLRSLFQKTERRGQLTVHSRKPVSSW